MKVSDSVTRPLAAEFLNGFRLPVASDLGHLFLEGDDDTILSNLAVYSRFDDGADPEQWCATQFLSKFDSFDVGLDKRAVALEKFAGSEKKCKRINYSIHTLLRSDPKLGDVFYIASGKIAAVLGQFDWDTAFRYMALGPGASNGLARRHASPSGKLDWLKPTVTEGSYDLATCFLQCAPGWEWHLRTRGGCLEVVPGNRIVTVPKNAQTDRVIAIEPLFNLIIQKGIGGVIRNRLKRVGINLDSQERNQLCALQGSIDRRYSTVDLSAASDSISTELCSLLLPCDWYNAMLYCRSPVGVCSDGSVISYQKISSMGNGFTFELESLLFWALSEAIKHVFCRGVTLKPYVYGDDIAVDDKMTDELYHYLPLVGFDINESKSYRGASSFRESCGKHYHNGRDITPVYLRKPVHSLERKFWFANQIRRFASQISPIKGYSCDSRFKKAWEAVVSTIPQSARTCSIPDGYGDGGLVRDFDEVAPKPISARNWVEGYCVRFFRRFYKTRNVTSISGVLAKTWAMEDGSVEDQRSALITPTSSATTNTEKYTFKRAGKATVVQQWRDLGPWADEF